MEITINDFGLIFIISPKCTKKTSQIDRFKNLFQNRSYFRALKSLQATLCI